MARSVALPASLLVLTNRNFAIKLFCTPAARWTAQFSRRLLAEALRRVRFIRCKRLADVARRSWGKSYLRSKAIDAPEQLHARSRALWVVCRSPSIVRINPRIMLLVRWSPDTDWV